MIAQTYCNYHGQMFPCKGCAGEATLRAGPPAKLEPKPEVLRAGIAGIFEAIVKERQFQDKKYGVVLTYRPHIRGAEGYPDEVSQGPGGHELGAWLIVIEKELDEAKDALVHGGSKKVTGRNTIRQELIQIATVAIAALEQHGLTEVE